MVEETRSRAEQILQAIIDGTPYDKAPQSRMEELLIELKNSGGGGGTSDYNQLSNKPSLNGKTLSGDLTSKDVDVESDYDTNYDPEEENLIISRAIPPNSGN